MKTEQKTQAVAKTEATPSALLELAVQQNLDIDKLEKLMAMQERWQAGQARKAFLNAITEFQSSCPELSKSKTVSFSNTKYKYAPLGEIAGIIKKPMKNSGLSHRWEIDDKGDKIACTCIISHVDGHSEKTIMSANKDASGGKNEIQQRGSSITYLQRYSLIAALGISTADEDTDGGQEQTVKQPEAKKPEAKKSQPKQPAKPKTLSGAVANCKEKKELDKLWSELSAEKQAEKRISELFENRAKELIKESEVQNGSN